jgi:hypothetical protein
VRVAKLKQLIAGRKACVTKDRKMMSSAQSLNQYNNNI